MYDITIQIIDVQTFVPPEDDPEIGYKRAVGNNKHHQY
jgi:hypothetical protein